MNNYTRGRAFEYQVRNDILSGRGFGAVFRTAGSHSPADLIVLWNRSRPYLVQCKSGKSRARGGKELIKLEDLATALKVRAVLATKKCGWIEYRELRNLLKRPHQKLAWVLCKAFPWPKAFWLKPRIHICGGGAR